MTKSEFIKARKAALEGFLKDCKVKRIDEQIMQVIVNTSLVSASNGREYAKVKVSLLSDIKLDMRVFDFIHNNLLVNKLDDMSIKLIYDIDGKDEYIYIYVTDDDESELPQAVTFIK